MLLLHSQSNAEGTKEQEPFQEMGWVCKSQGEGEAPLGAGVGAFLPSHRGATSLRRRVSAGRGEQGPGARACFGTRVLGLHRAASEARSEEREKRGAGCDAQEQYIPRKRFHMFLNHDPGLAKIIRFPELQRQR